MVLGIVLAAVAFLLIVLVFGRGGGGTGNQQTAKVVVARVDIPVGTQISDQLVQVVDYPSDKVPSGAKTDITCPAEKGASPPPCTNGVVGFFAAVAITKNMPLTDSILVSSLSKLPPVKKPFLDIPAGQVAISIPAGGELQTVGGFIQPDDRVDVIATGLPQMKAGTWRTIIQNVRIMHSGPVGSANTQGLTSSYILFVPLDQAEDLSYLFSNGTYKFVLRSPLDYKPDDKIVPGTGSGASTDGFNSKYGVPK
jgi:Flp pilus assembly protein CpaB